MKTLICIAASLLLSIAAQAEVAIFLQSYTQTETGLGKTINSQFTGYFIFNNLGSPLVQMDVSARSKSFRVWSYSTYTANYVRTAAGQTLLSSVPLYDTGSYFMKGTVSSVPVGTGLMPIPKSMTVSGTCVTGTDPDGVVIEFKGHLTLDRKSTQSANLAGNDVNAALATLKANLTGKGFAEIQ